jgi:site-specific recombinase XerD
MSAESLSEQDKNQANHIIESVVNELQQSLESMPPREAVDKYFRNRNLSKNTAKTHRSSLYNHFVPWCEEVKDIQNMNEITGNKLAEYKMWREEQARERIDGNKVSVETIKTQQQITRAFIKYCETLEVVKENLHERVQIPDSDDKVRETILDSERISEILDYLEKYKYASRPHVILLLLASTGVRMGSLRALDRDDFKSDEDNPCLKLEHRPESGTSLKNKDDSKRSVGIEADKAKVIDDYINSTRIAATDEYDRKPLLTTKNGRIGESTIRQTVYAWTRPCAIGKDCPHGRVPEGDGESDDESDDEDDVCKAARRRNWASRCPDSLSSHTVRKGFITEELASGVPVEILSGKCDVSKKILEKHYDMRKEEQKMEARMEVISMIHENNSGYIG